MNLTPNEVEARDAVVEAWAKLIDLCDTGHVPIKFGMGIDLVTVSAFELKAVLKRLDEVLGELIGPYAGYDLKCFDNLERTHVDPRSCFDGGEFS